MPSTLACAAALAALTSVARSAAVGGRALFRGGDGNTHRADIVVLPGEGGGAADTAAARTRHADANAVVVESLHEAADAAAALRAAPTPSGQPPKPVVIELAPGVHRLRAPLRLTAAHSGTVWVGAKDEGLGAPVVSGGVAVTEWSESKSISGAWTTPIPPGVSLTRTLWVNGVRRNRTVVTGADSCGIKPKSGVFSFGGETIALVSITAAGYVANSSTLLKLANPSDVELLYTRVGSSWTEGRCTLERVDPHPSGAELVVKQPCFGNQLNKSFGQAVTFPRSLEQLSAPSALAPGSWYLDRAGGEIVFRPNATDAALGAAGAVASVVPAVGVDSASTALLDIDGATDVSIQGVGFAEGGGWQGASTPLGYTETQAAYHFSFGPGFDGQNDSLYVPVPAAVHVHGGSRGVWFDACSFTRMGASAVMFNEGTQDSGVTRSLLADLSGSAVVLGQVDDWSQRDAGRQNRGLVIAGNTMTQTSVEYRGSPAVTAGYVADTVIEHNEIFNLTYSGVSLGWGWGREDSYARNNTVRFNHIHHHMCGPLFDGGGVYTLGPQGSAAAPSTVHDNYIHDQCNFYGCLYHDGGSGFFHSFNNVIHKCEHKMWLLINGNSEPNGPHSPPHFTYQGNIAVDATYVGPPNKAGDAPRVNCPGDKAQNCTVTGTVFMSSDDVSAWPEGARTIVANAGPRP